MCTHLQKFISTHYPPWANQTSKLFSSNNLICCFRLSDDIPAGRAPQEQSEPEGVAFSVAARSQVHSPAGRAPIITC
jgi:hypothetical protein